ncbi:uncharacterized protein METZ01_LOCUS362927, partial [marine metagenome]
VWSGIRPTPETLPRKIERGQSPFVRRHQVSPMGRQILDNSVITTTCGCVKGSVAIGISRVEVYAELDGKSDGGKCRCFNFAPVRIAPGTPDRSTLGNPPESVDGNERSTPTESNRCHQCSSRP